MSTTKRGRPKRFDEQEALQKAMLLFWQNGYIATSISDLTQALGITAPSLYCSFGDKASLFNRCIDYYLTHEACPILPIMEKAKTAKVAFELLMYDSAKRLVQPDKPMGCMLITATMSGAHEIPEVQHNVQEKRKSYKQHLLQRLQLGIEQGDVAANAPIQAITDFYLTVINGLTVQACDGASLEELNHVIFNAIQAWPIFQAQP
ncbi:TetR/AcrR family transcriptional regulator [Pseudomonas sp. F1_0610]|uniref:TetR/AcrR family transcriptional regulator n=1 Tax=Pseudomonas sp. F1_0610 TaxID=3114284 RepID=UPI0039C18AB4